MEVGKPEINGYVEKRVIFFFFFFFGGQFTLLTINSIQIVNVKKNYLIG